MSSYFVFLGPATGKDAIAFEVERRDGQTELYIVPSSYDFLPGFPSDSLWRRDHFRMGEVTEPITLRIDLSITSVCHHIHLISTLA